MSDIQKWPERWSPILQKPIVGDPIPCMVPHEKGNWVRIEDVEVLKRCIAAKDAALMDAAQEREQAWLVALLDMFPELDLRWPQGTQDLWWASFRFLKGKIE